MQRFKSITWILFLGLLLGLTVLILEVVKNLNHYRFNPLVPESDDEFLMRNNEVSIMKSTYTHWL